MHITTSLLAALVLCPLAILSQATGTAAVTPQQTIVPFSTLPACAAECYPLYNAQGACSPPIVPSTSSLSCFCAYGSLQPFYTTTAGVCDGACPNDPNGLSGIQSWFQGLCAKGTSQTTATGGSSTATTSSTDSGTAAPVNGGGSGASSGSSNGPWISNHWQWIIMIVILTLAIILGWIGACLLRRRYIRRKEREYELRPPAAPWVAGATHPSAPGPSPYGNGVLHKGKERESGMFVSRPTSAAIGIINEKHDGRKKWVVKERT